MMRLDHLPNQRPDEHVILFLRRHWFALLAIVAAFVLLVGVPLAAGWYFLDLVEEWLAHPVIGPLFVIVGSIYFLSIWLFAFLEFTDYYLDTWIITNERIINIEQEGLFNRTASELDLAAVQDTTAEIRGILQTLFTYGQVYVQTAGEKGRFHFKNIDNPEHVKELITQLVEEDKRRVAMLGASGEHGKVKSVIK
ncbi:MAG: PH domain-containing protein [Candidatus Uhrbacteria bacterium]|nr:PH domain-containing protein [Candidatus Uhrbacteria bacterium]